MVMTPCFGRRQVRPAEMAKMFGFDVHHRMSDGAEIVDQSDPVDAEPVANLCGPDDPGLLVSFNASPMTGQATAMAAVRAAGHVPAARRTPPKRFARLACVSVRERGGIAEARDAAMVNVGDGEPRVGASDIDALRVPLRGQPPRALPRRRAPAPSAPCRMKANSSRPVPNGGGGGSASRRPAHFSSSTSAVSSPRLAQSRTISPSRSLAIGPPPSASGLTWIAAGTLPERPTSVHRSPARP